MNDKHWVVSLYETFAMRDLVGYVAPGGVLIVGSLWELGKTQLLRDVVSHPWGLVLLAAASYLTAIGLRLLATMLRILLFSRDSGLFGDVSADASSKLRAYFERLLWRCDDKWRQRIESSYTEEERPSLIRREVVFMHATGLAGMAFLVLGIAVICLNQNGLSKTLTLSQWQIVVVLFFASAVFLLGHYRHAHQRRLLLLPFKKQP